MEAVLFYFSNKHFKGNSNILLIENDERLLENKKVADVFNSCFQSITDFLDLFEMLFHSTNQICDSIEKIINRFRFHVSIKNIKRNYKITSKFSFNPVSEECVKDIVNDLSSSKAADGKMPLKISKEYDFFFIFLETVLINRGFRKTHSSQHALFRLIQSWQKGLDESGFVGTVLTDLSKTYDCLPRKKVCS